MRVLLRDLAPGQDYAIQFRSNDGAGQVSEWSQVQRFTSTNDTIRPGNVQNLSWYNSGSTFIGQWDALTLDEQGHALKDLRYYRCNVSDGTTSKDFYVTGNRFDFTKDMNLALFGSIKTTLTLKVWGVDLTYNESNLPATVALNPLFPSTPNLPTVGNYLGLLMVSWDGKSSSGGAMESNVDYAEVHVSTTSGFLTSASTYAGRVYKDGSANKTTISGLVYGTTYYVRLVAINTLGKASGASAQASGSPARVSGLDIANNQISPAQINFTAKDIGGANAYYNTSQPVNGNPGINLKAGDIWYDTDNDYATYRYDGTTWVAAPEIGVLSGSKILAGTVTADAIGTNFFSAYQARIGSAFIDSAMISTIQASQIRTGQIAADQRVIAGDINARHAEMNSTGFYVREPKAGYTDPWDTTQQIDRIRLGTGVTDFLGIPDPADQGAALASLDEGGNAAVQGLSTTGDPVFGPEGRALSEMMYEKASGVISYTTPDLTGDIGPIRSRYGLYQLNADLKADRLYRFNVTLTWHAEFTGSEGIFGISKTNDGSDPLTDASGASTSIVYKWFRPGAVITGNWVTETFSILFNPGLTASYKFLLWAEKGQGDGSMWIQASGFAPQFSIEDVANQGIMSDSGVRSSGGGTIYGGAVVPRAATVPQTRYVDYQFDWVRSYRLGTSYMTNTNGKAFQGTDPSGFNGQQSGLFGWQNVDFKTLLSGARIQKIVLYLYFANWYNNNGGTAIINYHGTRNDPLAGSRPAITTTGLTVPGWPKPSGREVDITAWAPKFQDGTFRGIALGPSSSSSAGFYGYATDARIKIWYTK